MSLSQAQLSHLQVLTAARPGWSVRVIEPLFHDEHQRPGEEHAYYDSHPYLRGMKDVLRCVNALQPSHVLDIGSPLAQNIAVSYLTDLTVLDVREHQDPSLGLKFIQGTACDLPFPSASQELVTSCWVMCHVGDGRYGDVLEPDGDVKMLQEIHRVLQPGGTAVLGVGPMAQEPCVLFNAHRIYSWPWLERIFAEVSFDLVEQGEYPVHHDMFVEPAWNFDRKVFLTRSDGMYGFVVLKRRLDA